MTLGDQLIKIAEAGLIPHQRGHVVFAEVPAIGEEAVADLFVMLME